MGESKWTRLRVVTYDGVLPSERRDLRGICDDGGHDMCGRLSLGHGDGAVDVGPSDDHGRVRHLVAKATKETRCG